MRTSLESLGGSSRGALDQDPAFCIQGRLSSWTEHRGFLRDTHGTRREERKTCLAMVLRWAALGLPSGPVWGEEAMEEYG